MNAHSHDYTVEDNSGDVEWNLEPPQIEFRRFEIIGCLSQTKEGDEAISGNGGDATGRYKRCKRNRTRQYGAQYDSAKYEHDDHGVFWLSICGNSANPFRSRENSIASDGKN